MEENNVVNTNPEQETDQPETSFTDAQKAEIAKMMQSESDRRVSQALAKQKKEYEKKLSLSQLDGAEREKAEKDQYISDLEQKIKDFNILQQRNEVMKTLSGRSLPADIADCLNISDDAEANQQIIATFDKVFKAAVKSEVEKRLANGNTPKANADPAKITKDDFIKMTAEQRTALYRESPDLYRTLADN